LKIVRNKLCPNFYKNNAENSTKVNISKFALLEELPTYAVVTNNIYVNCHFTGKRMQNRGGQDPDRLLYGACLIIDTLLPGFDSLSAVTELERKVIFSNNSNYLDPRFLDFYDEYNSLPTSEDPILAEPVMNILPICLTGILFSNLVPFMTVRIQH
jgi:hypothetical protein